MLEVYRKRFVVSRLEMQDANVSYSHTLGHEADIKDVALVSGSADYTAKIWKVNADGKVC